MEGYCLQFFSMSTSAQRQQLGWRELAMRRCREKKKLVRKRLKELASSKDESAMGKVKIIKDQLHEQ